MAVRAYWLRGLANYGDKLTPWLVERISGEPPQFVQIADSGRKLVGAGSVLNSVRRGCVVWGTGMLSKSDVADPRADYRAVRGPLTARQIASQGGKPPAVFGDPGLLLPRWLAPSTKRHRVGIVPHYVHHCEALSRYESDANATVIDVTGSVQEVTDQITACECIASSSLHGLVAACAYGIPHARLKFGRPLGGDDSKFADFYMGIGAEHPPVLKCSSEAPSAVELEKRMQDAPSVDASALWDACPVAELSQE